MAVGAGAANFPRILAREAACRHTYLMYSSVDLNRHNKVSVADRLERTRKRSVFPKGLEPEHATLKSMAPASTGTQRCHAIRGLFLRFYSMTLWMIF